MRPEPGWLTLETVDGAQLRAVPSVHFRLPFAVETNQLAADWRPDAIAVELGPESAAATLGFLKDDLQMSSDAGRRNVLPSMLALMSTNQRLHPRARDAAIKLQRQTKKPLDEQSLETLKSALGYSSFSVLYLSSTDSIVEAVRCAVELAVPLYGVDAEHVASAPRDEIIIQDPLDAIDCGDGANHQECLENYIKNNARISESQRDDEIDGRREAVMAARLKRLLLTHRRVLFVCGLAHWRILRDLLMDTSTPMAPTLIGAEELETPNFRKVLVHPVLAVSHLDTYPSFASNYERNRKHAADPNHGRFKIQVWEDLNNILQETCDDHFLRKHWREILGQVLCRWERTGPTPQLKHEAEELLGFGSGSETCDAYGALKDPDVPPDEIRSRLEELALPTSQLVRTQEDWEALPSFQKLLANLSILRLRSVPELHTILSAAQGVMSDEFRTNLAEKLMSLRSESRAPQDDLSEEQVRANEMNGVDWISHTSFPDYPILAPAPSEGTRWQRAQFIDGDGRPSEHFFIDSEPGRSGLPVRVPVPWNWQKQPQKPLGEKEKGKTDGNSSSWIVVDNLLSLLCLRAFKLSRQQAVRPRIEEFSGALHDGIAIKPTLRNMARGNNRVAVWVSPRNAPKRESPEHDEADSFPIVWIYQPQSTKASWGKSADSATTLIEAAQSAAERGRDGDEPGRSERLERAALWLTEKTAQRGSLISAIYPQGQSERMDALCRPGYEVKSHSHYGELRFNPVPGIVRTAEWIYRTRRKSGAGSPFSCPYGGSMFGFDLDEHFSQFGFRPADHDWPVAMVLMAIPYALHSVTVVAPDSYTFPRIVHQFAARHGKELRFVPLSFFPAESVRRVTKYIMCPTLGRTEDKFDLPIYPEHVHGYFDEPLVLYRNLIPKTWH